MKNTSVVLLSVLALAFAGAAEAAKPKKRTRNTNRIGAYGVGTVGQSTYTSDVTEEEAFVGDVLASLGAVAQQDLQVSSDDSDIGYQASFGYRFNRYVAAELGLVQFGDAVSQARADLDFDDGNGFVPSKADLSFTAGGPLFSVIGLLPLNDRFEVFARAGYLFSSAKREIQIRVDGQNAGFGTSKGESQDLVLGAGATFHFDQVYSLRLEYLQIDGVGDDESSGTEDLNVIGLGLVVRF